VYAEAVAAARQLEALLCAPEANPDFVGEVGALAWTLCHVCELDPDAALAHIMFARDVRYPVRQPINVAILTALLLARSRNDLVRTQAAVCAALTMNLTIQSVQDSLYRQQTMDASQRQSIAAHPVECARLLAALGVHDPLWLTTVEQHHEFVDGSGYSKHLTGNAIARGPGHRPGRSLLRCGYRAGVPARGRPARGDQSDPDPGARVRRSAPNRSRQRS